MLQNFTLKKNDRANLKNQKPRVLWFTGLSGSGKSTIANFVEQELFKLGKHSYILDGDNIRDGLSKDLGFSEKDRIENIRRVSQVAKLMIDAGLIVLVTLISPYKKDRELARQLFSKGEFFEIYVNTTLEVAQSRDPKGLYKLATQGIIKDFTGISSSYEIPEAPDFIVSTQDFSAEFAAKAIVSKFFV